jgi:hypothetical protein
MVVGDEITGGEEEGGTGCQWTGFIPMNEGKRWLEE